jgi:prepilin-type N-terminal cleavage/methylation domain-containing protein
MKVQQRSEAGYSLPEMLVVVAIIGLLALVTVPAFITFMQSNKMKTSMRSFSTDLRGVRQFAISQGRQTVLTYATGTDARSYDYFLGDKPFGSTSWTKITGTAARPTRVLDNVVYFPANAAPTPQTFTDVLDCSTPPCVAGTDGRIDVIFFPDGRVQIPGGAAVGQITIMTDMKIPKPQYTINITPSGRVQAQ